MSTVIVTELITMRKKTSLQHNAKGLSLSDFFHHFNNNKRSAQKIRVHCYEAAAAAAATGKEQN